MMIKKVTVMLILALFALCLPMNSFAESMDPHDDHETKLTVTQTDDENVADSENNDNPTSDEEREAVEQLMSEWEGNGYPDNVGHVMMDNDGKIIIGLVDNSESAQADIKAMVDEPDLLNFESAKYSYNDLLATNDEIVEIMTEQSGDSQEIYGVGT